MVRFWNTHRLLCALSLVYCSASFFVFDIFTLFVTALMTLPLDTWNSDFYFWNIIYICWPFFHGNGKDRQMHFFGGWILAVPLIIASLCWPCLEQFFLSRGLWSKYCIQRFFLIVTVTRGQKHCIWRMISPPLWLSLPLCELHLRDVFFLIVATAVNSTACLATPHRPRSVSH